jgi:hypothetical protein
MHLSSLLAATGVLISGVLTAPAQQEILGLGFDQFPLSHPDFDLDLDARRLVQFGENEEPVWVTELEKVLPLPDSVTLLVPYSHNVRQIQAKAEGRNFFDM